MINAPTSLLPHPLLLTMLLLGASSWACSASDTDDDVIAHNGPPGRIASYIRGDTHPRLVIEVDSVPGLEPYDNTTSRLESGLEEILDKPEGVEVVLDGTIEPRGEDHAWSHDALFDLAEETFDLEVPDDTAKMHALFVDGHDENDTDGRRTLGLAWSNRHIVMYKQTLERACTGIVPGLQQQLCENAETSVFTHEVGHVIGLVDLGLPMVMDHKDPDHGPHSDNQDCVMYYTYSGEQVINRLADRIVGGDTDAMGFDRACLDDIAALRDAP